MANILSQEELEALLREMKQIREEEPKESDIHIAATPIGRLQDTMATPQNEVNLEVTLNLPVQLSAELGRAQLHINEILQLTQGSIIELDNKSKSPLLLMIKDQILAEGEVVVKEEKFALRITKVDPIRERIQKLDR